MPVRQTVDPASAAKFNAFGFGRVHMDHVLGEEAPLPLDNKISWIHPHHPDALGLHLTDMAQTDPISATWTPANAAHLYPYTPSRAVVSSGAWVLNGAVVSGNFDLGLYNAAFERLRSTGSTPQVGVHTVQQIAWTNFTLAADTLYWIAMACNNTTATFYRNARTDYLTWIWLRIMRQLTSFPLPATIAAPVAVPASPRLHGLIR